MTTTTRTLVAACAAAVLSAPSHAEAQASLAAARDLYASAAYTEALVMLNSLAANQRAREERQMVDLYRTLCLVALGRKAEADTVVEARELAREVAGQVHVLGVEAAVEVAVEEADLLIEGVQMIRDVMASSLISGEVKGEFAPGSNFADETALRRELPNRIHSVYHPVGTARMGVDERAVVDPQLRVLGVDGLRVADASIMPSITGGNTNAPAMMIGEHCAALMR